MTAGSLASRRRLLLGLFVAWTCFSLVLTSIPDLAAPEGIPGGDKTGHFGLYGLMALLFTLWRLGSGDGVRKAFLLALLFVSAWGALDELHQLFVPGRSGDPADWLADVAGGGSGAAFGALLPRFLPGLLAP